MDPFRQPEQLRIVLWLAPHYYISRQPVGQYVTYGIFPGRVTVIEL